MSGQVSSPEPSKVTPNSPASLEPSAIPAEWRRFGAFLRSPALPEKAAPFSLSSLRAVVVIFGLDLAAMSVIIGTAILIFSFGYELPSNKLAELELGLPIILLIVVGAPLFEEIGFRGWLAGRPAHVWPLIIIGAAAFGLPLLVGQGRPLIVGGGLIIALIAAIILAWRLWGRTPFKFFSRYFGWFYALSTLAFAVVHLSNYDDANPAFLLLVIPQAVAGLLFGYTRVQYGLWASILLHALHNGTFIALAMMGKSAA
ncbi:CPBP family intramembrane glutamic endopeptidase [Altererythrobacter sp. ZODW24]|uniref:CPBP family intramembrane glutamic endopeptidase n=1 Tax=Altererythrobacter sp. ZODW24 TaxID=2185142 RepID=UPI000DF75A02|nr:CPBP family intramembrane glutamic endopeptidase [Altererythrobacter sp. ZODW24]